jgi:hypothetical protein
MDTLYVKCNTLSTVTMIVVCYFSMCIPRLAFPANLGSVNAIHGLILFIEKSIGTF